MYIVIVGAGDIGLDLALTLLKHKHKVTIIERKKETANKIIQGLNIVVIQGDGTNFSILQDAEVDKADIFIAVMPRDQDNLIACQLASKKFDVKRTIARVRKPYNMAVFAKLGGITNTVSATDMISKLVEEEVADEQVTVLQILKEGKAEIVKVKITPDSLFSGEKIKNLKLPENCVITAVSRREEVLLPEPDFQLEPGDEIIAYTTSKGMVNLGEILRSSAES
jgi:trk system potassium uptake protein